MKRTDAGQFINDLDAGIFAEKIAHTISDVALNTVENGGKKKGKIVITLDFEKLGNQNQVKIAQTLSFSAPTSRGKRSEDDTTETIMHVNAGGNVSIFPENQHDFFQGDKKQAHAN